MYNIEEIFNLASKFEKQASLSQPDALEALMVEHAILDRLLLVYESCISKLEANDFSSLKIIKKVALIVRKNVEFHHEVVEERTIFKTLLEASKLKKTINTLIEQHKTSRKITSDIIDSCSKKISSIQEKNDLIVLIKSFIRMYRSHASIENTFVFPEIRNIMDAKQYKRYNKWFHKKEEAVAGEDDFEKIIKNVESLEKEVGINKLEDFTL